MTTHATHAPGLAGTARLPDDAHVGRVRLRVADLERSLGFYRDLLGFRVVRRENGTATLSPGGQPEGADALAEGRELIVLREVPGIARRSSRPRTTGLYHVALLLPSRAALGRTIAALHQAGYPLRGMSDHWVSESLYLDDPDGNGLEIYADRPRSAWPVENGVVQMAVEPIDLDGVMGAARANPGPWTGLPAETTIGHVHFTVSRLDPAVDFYHRVLGFDVMMSVPTLVAVSAGGYHHHLNLNTWAGEGAPADSDAVAGLDGWELVVPDAAARDAAIERLGGAAGRDPDAIAVEIVA